MLYREAPAQHRLRALSRAERQALLERTLRQAAGRLPGAGTPLLQRLTELELARQLELLERWVELDLERQEFVAVQVELATEAAEIGPRHCACSWTGWIPCRRRLAGHRL